MAAYTDTHGFDKGSAAHPAKGQSRVSYVEVVMDFAAITTARAAAGATALGSDSLQVISVPANASLVVSDTPIYLMEGDLLKGGSSAASSLDLFISYETLID